MLNAKELRAFYRHFIRIDVSCVVMCQVIYRTKSHYKIQNAGLIKTGKKVYFLCVKQENTRVSHFFQFVKIGKIYGFK